MATIFIQNCNTCEVSIPQKYGLKLYKDLSVRHPNAFYLKRQSKGNWDGIVHFINQRGIFKIGMLPRVVDLCKSYGLKIKIVDERKPVPKVTKVVTKTTNFKLRPEQIEAVKSVVNNRVQGANYHIGVLDYTVNAGKTLIMTALYLTYQRKLRTLLITNDSDWLNQARTEFKDYLPDEDITFIQGTKKLTKWTNFNIGMVQTLSRNIKKFQNELTKIDMVLVDEADLGGSKSYQTVLTHLWNTRIRIGLSGTIYMSKFKKDQLKNWNLEAFFGPKLAEFKLKESIEKGYSTKTVVKAIDYKPYYGNWECDALSYKDEYDDTITNNHRGLRMVIDRVRYNLHLGRWPLLIVTKYIDHCENIYKYLQKHNKVGHIANIAYVHVDTPTSVRKRIMQEFREGKLHILVSTTIIARGKNFPLLKAMINAAGFKAEEKNIQFLGRLVRTHESKKKAYLDDLQYPGHYLGRHSRARIRSYKKQGFKVINVTSKQRNLANERRELNKVMKKVKEKTYEPIPPSLFQKGRFKELCEWCESHPG